MKRELGWFRIGSGLILSLLFLMAFPACTRPFIEVSVGAKCEPQGGKEVLPTGMECPTNSDGDCVKKPKHCTCPPGT